MYGVFVFLRVFMLYIFTYLYRTLWLLSLTCCCCCRSRMCRHFSFCLSYTHAKERGTYMLVLLRTIRSRYLFRVSAACRYSTWQMRNCIQFCRDGCLALLSIVVVCWIHSVVVHVFYFEDFFCVTLPLSCCFSGEFFSQQNNKIRIGLNLFLRLHWSLYGAIRVGK